MKKLAFLLMIVFVGSITFSYAGQPEPKDTKTVQIQQEVKKKMKYPATASEQMIEGEVWVTIKVNQEGQVIVQEANSLEQVLKEGVVKQLNKMKVSKDLYDAENAYLMKFNFDLVNK